MGSEIGDPENAREALVKDSEVEVKRRNEDGEEEIVKEVAERPMPRRTEADENGDTRTLNRALTRTLYLLVRTRNPVAEQERQSQNTQQTQPGDKRKIPGKWQAQERGEWRFPESELLFDEALHMVRFKPFPVSHLLRVSFFLPFDGTYGLLFLPPPFLHHEHSETCGV